MNRAWIIRCARAMSVASLLVVAVVLVPSALAQTAAPSESSLAQRLQRLENVEEIRTLLLEYGRSLDARDLAKYGSLFTSDGEWSGGMGTVRGGPKAIQTFMEKAFGTGGGAGASYHLMSNFVIDVQGNTARAWSRWTFVTPGSDGRPVIRQAGRYEDQLSRENGRWKFRRRLALNDLPAPAPPKTP